MCLVSHQHKGSEIGNREPTSFYKLGYDLQNNVSDNRLVAIVLHVNPLFKVKILTIYSKMRTCNTYGTMRGVVLHNILILIIRIPKAFEIWVTY